MVSRDLVVLLIVCVGINTGSAGEIATTPYKQNFACFYAEYCQNGQYDDSVCEFKATDITSFCVSATMQCWNRKCSTSINSASRSCYFDNIHVATISTPIQCCFCNDSTIRLVPMPPWWDCEIVTTTITPSLTSHITQPSPSPIQPHIPISSGGEFR